ncbi:amidophosphoribosyltransferase [Clostridium tetanomorphum]|uniref:Amidophosphoribosyltransferase n=1 Tax=Clostridium tetanomorphum TaxID=1553 RepID=A0A923EC42_CLOTT|nr:amidophosphoribosyltransferase [Clostridium tetanomorphum]KAJ49586.1 amidophosphoribosyltransferase [Clostridium tetanomorphum DSM 665]KAJ51755.1 amidophosphoribosyltransferase [Clostridium tetanomorphum DSM 665]MBC2397638.1 amidophosphoribosyltransferase [Clostridium tetanomorphum]MBP1864990.1 amidophosphoribosyltransferase [Clostridium tetanomorphum]NRS83413.1 amidophosphoribosyltransferase [Clostridium tetanomorphum]
MNDDKFKEECGVFGVFSKRNFNTPVITYYGLYALQHRGQESAGIAVTNGQHINTYKSMGLVDSLLEHNDFSNIKGKFCIGHVRYSTTGESKIENAQPFICNSKIGQIALAHNGNVINKNKLKEELGKNIIFESTTDSEIILRIIVKEIDKGKRIEEAIISTLKLVKGAYSLVILAKNKLIGIRDPKGIRPLSIGKLGDDSIISSESCGITSLGGEIIRDVEPGEMVLIQENGIKSIRICEKEKNYLCTFEYIYFAREDSIIDNINVYVSRVLAGEELFKECPAKGDIVIGVPDSGVPAAMGYAKAAGIAYNVAIVKNRYIGRTFINPYEKIRRQKISIKLSPIKVNVYNKSVIVVDDSMIRGTTARSLIKILRNAGAKEVHFRIASPIVKSYCKLGLDIKYKKELISYSRSIDEIKNSIGADSIGFLSLEGLHNILGKDKSFCFGCFNGKYPYN